MTNNLKGIKLKILIFVIITCLLCSTFLFYEKIEIFINNYFNPVVLTDVENCEMKVHFIDVGQGDSILIELPDEKIMLVDAGPSSSEDKLLNYLKSIFSQRSDSVIDYFVVTHQDEDHSGGADVVFQNYDVLNFYRPNVFTDEEIETYGYTNVGICNTLCYTTMIELMHDENCDVFLNTMYESMPKLEDNIDYNIQFLSPIDDTYTTPNNYSPIIILSYQNRKIMLTGDAEEKVEEQVLNKYGIEILSCDVLKLGHHGSSTSTSLEFLSTVSPLYAVISVGEDNSYGHPNEDVLARVEAVVGKNKILRTDINGNIVVGVDKDEQTNGKGNLNIATNKAPIVYTYIHWWTVVVVIEGLCFIIIFIPKYNKKIKKNKK